MRTQISYPAGALLKDMFLVIDENTKETPEDKDDITPEAAKRMKKELSEARKNGTLKMEGVDSNWIWRLCAARLMRAQFDKDYCWLGFQYRSEWALNHYKWGHQWHEKWEGGNCKLRVLGEQGIGDEILFASTFRELLEECPDSVIEVDNRLLPVINRSFDGNFVSRWILGDGERIPPSPEHYDDLEIMEEYDSYLCCADLLPKYRTGKLPPGEPYLKPNPDWVEYYKNWLSQFPGPYIGISWFGGRSELNPENLRVKEGTYISLQYSRLEYNGHTWMVGTEGAPNWIKVPPVDHNDMDQVFALCEALDEVVTVQNYIVHVCGSIGKTCHAIKPPPIFGEVGTRDSNNNRLKWPYGIGDKTWIMPWYNSVRVYKDDAVYRSCYRHRLDLSGDAKESVRSRTSGYDSGKSRLGPDLRPQPELG